MHSNQEAKSMLSEMISLAKADNQITEAEFQFLMSMAAQFGFSVDDLHDIMEQPVDFDPPSNEFDRIVQFQRLILLMNIDLNNSQEERQFIVNSAMRLGLPPNATNLIIEKMSQYPDKVIPPDELISIYKTHHN